MIVTGICNGCGKKIVWLHTEDGKKIPLDPAPPVYYISGQTADSYTGKRANGNKERAIGQAMVSHFTTCPKASQF